MQLAIQASLGSDSGKRKTTEITDDQIMKQLAKTNNSVLSDKYGLILLDESMKKSTLDEIRQNPQWMQILFGSKPKRTKSSAEVDLLLL